MKWLRFAFFVAALLAACTRQVDGNPTASVVVGPDGGSLTFEGLTVEVPAGALATQVTLSVAITPTTPSGHRVDGVVYRFEPAGTRFAVPITVTFPTGSPGENVFWTVDGSEDTFQSLATTIHEGRATAHPTHFSLGFVGSATTAGDAEDGAPPDATSEGGGPSAGVQCEVKRRATVDGTCTQITNVETDVAFWLVPYEGDPEGALATSSAGIHAFYAQAGPNAPLFRATDATHKLYTAPGATAERVGDTIVFTMTASRSGVASTPACETIPIIAVTCSGRESLLPNGPLSPDGGSPTDASSDGAEPDGMASDTGPGDGAITEAGSGDADPGDAPDDADASVDAAPEASSDGGPDATTGVTCLVKERFSTSTSCVQLEGVETNVRFWLVYDNGRLDPEGGLATDSDGLKRLFNNTWPDAPLWNATNATKTVYTGYFGVGTRSGNTLSFTLDGSRWGAVSEQCLGIPLIEVHCSGTTTLGR